jgi:hypothetical protein
MCCFRRRSGPRAAAAAGSRHPSLRRMAFPNRFDCFENEMPIWIVIHLIV